MSEREIFSGAIKLSGAAREEFLSAACGHDRALRAQVESLLQAHDQSQELALQPASLAPEATRSEMPETAAGTLVAGRYKLLESIGEGGMGSVWLAEQKEPVKRKVAVKLIKPGMDSKAVLTRFEAERQALAVMDHPNIAKVFDGGMTSEGRPYFVMELVRGIPLTEYCDQMQLSVRERLELFGQVCSAVQHAHQKGIIHRDLKPSNILVTEHDGKPVCKVIDFGLAKAMHGAHALTDASMHTAFGAVVGTPLYMAPEQLRTSALDIDTRADLYSLGVILYELLTGTTPIERQRLKEAAWEEIRRLVREEEPPKPSTRLSSSASLPSVAARRHIEPARLTGLVRGELDWIVMKALAKDRNRRYETANGLALDIQRHLAGEPVFAAPPSRRYRLRKFLQRNRGPVLAGSLVLVALVAGVIGTSYGLIEANTKRQEAERQQARAEQREQDAIDAVKRFGDTVRNNKELKNSAQLEQLRRTLLQEPLAFFKSLTGRLIKENDSRPEALHRLAAATNDLGLLSKEIGDIQNAKAACEQSLAILQRLVQAGPTNTEFQRALAQCHNNIGLLLLDVGRPTHALAAHETAREICERLVAEQPDVPEFQSQLSDSHHNIGNLLFQTGRLDDALAELELARVIQERLVQAYPQATEFQSGLAITHLSIGELLRRTSRWDAALASLEEARTIQAQLVEANPNASEFQSILAGCHHEIGILHRLAGRPDAAIAAYEQAREIQDRLVQAHPTINEYQQRLADCHNSIGIQLGAMGRLDEALAANGRSREIYQRLVQANPTVPNLSSGLAMSLTNSGLLLSELGRSDDAYAEYERARKTYEQLVTVNPTIADYHCEFGGTLNNLAVEDERAGRLSIARDLFRKAIEQQNLALAANPLNPTYQAFLANHIRGLLRVLAVLPDDELAPEIRNVESEKLLTELQEKIGLIGTADALGELANTCINVARFNEAEGYQKRGLELRRQQVADAAPNSPELAWQLALYFMDCGIAWEQHQQPLRAIDWYSQALVALRDYATTWPGPDVRNQLRWAYQNRGWCRVLTGEYAQAIKDFDEALNFCSPADRNYVSSMRASTRLRLGTIDEALAEIQPLEAQFGGTSDEAYNLACFYAVAAEKIPDECQAHSDKAMEYLQKAVDAGWSNAKHLATDIDLNVLRDRKDFRALTAKLEENQAKQ